MIESNFSIEIKGTKDLIDKFNAIQKISFRTVFKDIISLMQNSIKKNFQVAGRPKAWKGLNKKYKARKTKQGFSPKTLIRTGNLVRSLIRTNSKSIHTVRPKYMGMGTSVTSIDGFPYWKVHQEGTTKAGRNRNVTIPQRKFAGFQKSDQDEIVQLFSMFIKKAIA